MILDNRSYFGLESYATFREEFCNVCTILNVGRKRDRQVGWKGVSHQRSLADPECVGIWGSHMRCDMSRGDVPHVQK